MGLPGTERVKISAHTADFAVVVGVTFAVRKKTWYTVDRDRRGDVVIVHAGSSWVDAGVS